MTLAVDVQSSTSWMPQQEMAWFGAARAEAVSMVQPLVSPETTVSLPAWLDEVGRRVGRIWELSRDWDGRGSAAIRRDAILFGWQLLWQTMLPNTAAPSLIPLGNGGIQMLWSNADAELAIEVIQPNDIYVYYLDRQADLEREWQAATEFSDVAALLREKFS